jgi:ElaB/YqjD/DUF883 family membrane-anchored ribosome-binding protein
LSTKVNREKEDQYKEVVKEMRKDFERKLGDMQKKLDKALQEGSKSVEGDDGSIAELKERLRMTRARATEVLESGQGIVKEHPIIVVGVALAFGVLLGALLGHKDEE